MSVSAIYRFYAIQFNGTQFTGPKYIGGVSTSAVTPSPQVVQEFTDGNPYPQSTTIRSIANDLTFTTMNVDQALDLIGTSGICIEDGSSIDIYYAKFDPCSVGPAAGSVHRKVTITQSGEIAGIIHPTNLTCEHRGDASYSFAIKPQSDGVNSPVVITPNVALPAGPIDNRNRFTIGPVSVSGVTTTGIKNVSVDFGIAVDPQSADSTIYDAFQSINQVATKLSLQGIDPSWFDAANLGISGAEAAHADSEVILRKRLKTGAGFELATATEHIQLTCAGLVVPTNLVSSSETNPTEHAFDVYCHHDGTNVPMVAATAYAYE